MLSVFNFALQNYNKNSTYANNYKKKSHMHKGMQDFLWINRVNYLTTMNFARSALPTLLRVTLLCETALAFLTGAPSRRI